MMRKVPYPTPGEILLREFLQPVGISAYRLAKDIGVPQIRISQIVAGKRAVTVDTGLRLSRYFGRRRRNPLISRQGTSGCKAYAVRGLFIDRRLR
jgi:addiction module HigA family antidote